MLDPKRLQIFCEVARLASFSAAAASLDYSQPAISHHIARLEIELGTRLLNRGQPGGVMVTEAGAILLEQATAILAHIEDAEFQLSAHINVQDRRIRVGAFPTAASTIVPDAIAEYKRRDPETPFSIVEAEAAETIEGLRSRRLDLGIAFDDPRQPLVIGDELEAHHIYTDPMFVALPPDHRLASQDYVDLTHLKDDEWIEGAGAKTPCSVILFSSCSEVGFEPKIAFSSGNYQTVQRLVGAGLGIALVPELALTSPGPQIAIRPLLPRTPFRRVSAIVVRGNLRRPATRTMFDCLQRACAAHEARRVAEGDVRLPAATLDVP